MATPQDRSLTHSTLIVTGVVLTAGALVALVLFAFDVVLLAFAGVLLAVLLDGLAGLLSRKTGLGPRAALAVVVVGIVGLLVGAGFIVGPQIAQQVGGLREGLTGGLDRLLVQARGVEWLRPVLEEMPAARGGSAEPLVRGALGRLTGAFSAALGFVTGALVIVFTGLYVASGPALYRDGLLRLVPHRRRARAREVLGKLGHALRMWLLAQFFSMLLVSTLATVVLLALGVPLALAVGLLVFVLTFIPYLGSLLAGIPVVLVALLEGPQTGLWAAGLYLVIQIAESYVITPLVQKRVVELAPAVLLIAEILFGVFAGVLGIALAAPLIVVVIVLVQMLYVEDVLGDEVEVLGEHGHGDAPSSG